jgi:hypothetical protein
VKHCPDCGAVPELREIGRGLELGVAEFLTGRLGTALNLRDAFFKSSSEQEER